MKKIIVFGGAGQLGSALVKKLSSNFKVYGVDRTQELNADITDFDSVTKVYEQVKPEIVINCAAYSNADLCEVEKEKAYKTNFIGNRNILTLAKKHHSSFVFISSYFVFDGRKREYDEVDFPTPLNYYGITKALSEVDTLVYPKSLVIRSSKIFSLGFDTRNFIARLYASLKDNKEFVAVNDQSNNPIHADLMAETIEALILKNKFGIFNVGGEDYLSNYELARRFAEHFGLKSSLITPSSTDKYCENARRPKDVRLMLNKIRTLSIKTYNLDEMFPHMKKWMKK